jgi:ABC-type branched-subunit amino acid transport system substrate-binding protein
MKSTKKIYFTAIIFCCLSLLSLPQAIAFEPLKGDLSNFDPNKINYPKKGDFIKIGHFEVYSGPSAQSGEMGWGYYGLVAQDINSQGGILVDGKRKMIKVVKADTMLKPAAAKRAAEKLYLEEKVNFMVGNTGTHIAAVGMEVAKKYKRIFLNNSALSESLMAYGKFNRYTFRCAATTVMMAKALAYAFAARPERKFYILCQDYAYGHAFGDAFKAAINEYRPEAKIVGEAYHPLMAKDFAPYITKVQGSGAEVIITGNYWLDANNVEKQVKQMGLEVKIAGPFIANPDNFRAMGGGPNVGTNELLVFEMPFRWDRPQHVKFLTLWNDRWKTWKKPYNTPLYKWPLGPRMWTSIYWILDLIQRTGTTDTEKLVRAWEGDEFNFLGYKVRMDPCNHETAMDMAVAQVGFPNKWQDDVAAAETPFIVPARFCLPWKDPKLCK